MGIVRDVVQIGAGTLNGIINSIGARKVHRWTLTNVDTGEKIEGQFGPVDPTESPGNPVYAEHTSLNRDKPILQFVHGTADGFSFGAYFFARSETDEDPFKKITALKKWRQRDSYLARPPIVAFYVGDNNLHFWQAVIASIGEIKYFDPPKHMGGIRGVSTTITLKEYVPWELKSEPAPETRYHHAKQGDYYELIAWREYRDPMLGDVVRSRNPEKRVLAVGDIVPLPSAEAIRTSARKPRSISFVGTVSSKDSVQKTNKREAFERHDRDYVSAIVPPGL